MKHVPGEPWHLIDLADGLELARGDVLRVDRGAASRGENEVMRSCKLFTTFQVSQDGAQQVRHGNELLPARHHGSKFTPVPLISDSDGLRRYPILFDRDAIVREVHELPLKPANLCHAHFGEERKKYDALFRIVHYRHHLLQLSKGKYVRFPARHGRQDHESRRVLPRITTGSYRVRE